MYEESMSLQTTKMASTSSASKDQEKGYNRGKRKQKDDIKRSFQKEWLTKYAWLKYEDGQMYCLVGPMQGI